jgi:hypothetical protein
MPTLFEKSGAEGDYRRFKFEMAKIAKENLLPGFELKIEPRSNGEPMLRMIKRAKDDEPGTAADAPSQSSPGSSVDGKPQERVSKRPEDVPAPAPAFPDGHIAYTAFGSIARASLPSPQRDYGLVADDFRAFMRRRDIARDAPNIAQIFATFCSKQRAAN